jgi:Spy/CpxP family protein refolding chaperone
MKRLIAALLTCLALTAQPTVAQEGSRVPRDPIGAQVLTPELIFQHQKAVGLTDAQRKAIVAEVKPVQGRLLELRLDLQQAVDRMVELMDRGRVDEGAATAQLEHVLAIERQMKLLQLGVAIRIKNHLTPEQQRLLKDLRAAPIAR